MSMLIAAFMFIPLLAISFAHLLWSFGRTWPIRDEQLLAQTVVGTPGVTRMPSRLVSLAVAVGTLVAGIVALSLADRDSGGAGLTLAGIACALPFLWRGAVGYTADWIASTPEPSFRFNDRRVYSPLCLFVGVGFVALVLLRLL